jgi:hypothetical protein
LKIFVAHYTAKAYSLGMTNAAFQTEFKTTKGEVIEAGKELASQSTVPQQENHARVLAWIDSLNEGEIPDYSHHKEGRAAGALLSYKMLIRAWYHSVHLKVQGA